MPLEKPEENYDSLLGLGAEEAPEAPQEESEAAQKSTEDGVDLLTRAQDWLVKTASDVNKVGIVLGSRYDDHSTRSNLSAIADQLMSIANSLNEKIVRSAAKGADVADLFPGD